MYVLRQDDFVPIPARARSPAFPRARKPEFQRGTSAQIAVLDAIFDQASDRMVSKIPRFASEGDLGIPGVIVHRLPSFEFH